MKRFHSLILCAAVLALGSCAGGQAVKPLERGKAPADMDAAFASYLQAVADSAEDLHSIMIMQHGKVLEEKDVQFDLRALLPGEKPLVWDETRATPFSVKLASTSGDVRVSFPDAKGIEHPLCLSNYGRRASDGSYLLGTLALAFTEPVPKSALPRW